MANWSRRKHAVVRSSIDGELYAQTTDATEAMRGQHLLCDAGVSLLVAVYAVAAEIGTKVLDIAVLSRLLARAGSVPKEFANRAVVKCSSVRSTCAKLVRALFLASSVLDAQASELDVPDLCVDLSTGIASALSEERSTMVVSVRVLCMAIFRMLLPSRLGSSAVDVDRLSAQLTDCRIAVCMYSCEYVSAFVYTCANACVCVCMHVSVHVRMRLWTRIRVRMHVCMRVCMDARMHERLVVCMHVCTHA